MSVEWPEHFIYAWEMMSYHSPYGDHMVEDLMTRWGGLEREVFERILTQRYEEYTVFALFALGYAPTSKIQELFVPFLSSKNPRERWASALGLGKLKDERALPVLLRMLKEFLSGQEREELENVDKWYYEDWRCSIPELLAGFHHSSLTPVLRHTLLKILQLESSDHVQTLQRNQWKRLKKEIVYALGRLEAFGALVGIPVEEQTRGVWLVHQVMGSFHTRSSTGILVKWQQNPHLYRDVQEKLEQSFGLDEETREQVSFLVSERSTEKKHSCLLCRASTFEERRVLAINLKVCSLNTNESV